MRYGKLIVVVMAVASTAGTATSAARAEKKTQPTKLFLDIHELGAGKVTPEAVANAHRKDLATEGKYGVHFRAYWLNQKQGTVTCLAEAPSSEAMTAVHKEAHGLMPDRVREVTDDNNSWTPPRGTKLFLDRHELGMGKVTAKDIAAAHQKDLAVQLRHGAHFLNYWFDGATGTVTCLIAAGSADDAIAAHKEAHGLVPDAIDEVIEGR